MFYILQYELHLFMYIKQKIQDLKCEPHLSIYDSALSLVAVNSYDRMTNSLYFWLLPFSPASNNIYHLLLQTTSKGCFTPSVITSVFNLAPSEEDGKLYAEASLLEMGTGIQRLSREGARVRGTILRIWGSEWAHLPLSSTWCWDHHRTWGAVLPEEPAVLTESYSASSRQMRCLQVWSLRLQRGLEPS